jgi:branched-subunit amino acid transport protein
MANIGFILAAALVTYATRIVGFGLGGRELPPALGRFLAYVPVAVFAALIAPDLGLGDAQWAARGLGVVAAAVAAWRTRQLWVGLATGMAAFWLVGLLT